VFVSLLPLRFLDKNELSPKTKSLLIFAFVVAAFDLFYELLISTVSSYFLGNSVLHFSVTIGLFMFFMGLGSYFSQFVKKKLLEKLIFIELFIGLIGGASALLLYVSFSVTEYYYLTALGLIAATSLLIGMEMPFLARLLKKHTKMKDVMANIMAFDYLGALIASFVFPLLMLPYLGTLRSGFLVGILNVFAALFLLFDFKETFTKRFNRQAFALAFSILLFFGFSFVHSLSITSFFETYLYQDQIVYAEQSAYQRIVMTQYKEDVRLYLNGNLQFSSIDEARYHESLVHIPMAFKSEHENVLVLGGGDGLVIRELLEYESVDAITLVDLDPAMTALAQSHPFLKELNGDSLSDPKVEILHGDAFDFVKDSSDFYSLVIIDLPDPSTLSLGKLYSKEFYALLEKRITADGLMVTQSSSPFFAREAFWSIEHTLAEVFEVTLPYQTYVPSFGPWGFNLASQRALPLEALSLEVETEYLIEESLASHFIFEKDVAEVETEINTLDNQTTVNLYQDSWEFLNE
jgi:spermidine synthase